MSSRGVNKFELSPTSSAKCCRWSHQRNSGASSPTPPQRRRSNCVPDNERNPVAGGFSLVWAFSAKNEVPRAPSATEPASRDRSAMHFPKRSFSRSKCKDLGFAGGAPQWHRDHQRRGFGGNSELPPRCKLHYLVTFARRAFGAGKGDASLVGWAIISRSCCVIAAYKAAKPGKILYEKVFCARGRMENLGELTDLLHKLSGAAPKRSVWLSLQVGTDKRPIPQSAQRLSGR